MTPTPESKCVCKCHSLLLALLVPGEKCDSCGCLAYRTHPAKFLNKAEQSPPESEGKGIALSEKNIKEIVDAIDSKLQKAGYPPFSVCVPKQSPPESMEERFDEEFTHRGDFDERKFDFFRIENYDKNSPIIHDDKVIGDLKDFIRAELALARNSALEEAIKVLPEKRPHEDCDAEEDGVLFGCSCGANTWNACIDESVAKLKELKG